MLSSTMLLLLLMAQQEIRPGSLLRQFCMCLVVPLPEEALFSSLRRPEPFPTRGLKNWANKKQM